MSTIVTIFGENIKEKMDYVFQKDDKFFDDRICYRSENPWDYIAHVTRHVLGVYNKDYDYKLIDDDSSEDKKATGYLAVLGAVIIQNMVNIGEEFDEDIDYKILDIFHSICRLVPNENVRYNLKEYPNYMPPLCCDYEEWYVYYPQRELVNVFYFVEEHDDVFENEVTVKLVDTLKEDLLKLK